MLELVLTETTGQNQLKTRPLLTRQCECGRIVSVSPLGKRLPFFSTIRLSSRSRFAPVLLLAKEATNLQSCKNGEG